MTAVTSQDQHVSAPKRKRSAIEGHLSTAIAQLPRKKAKGSHQSHQETNTAFWDALSKQWLTHRALDELNRRNRQTASPVKNTSRRSQDLEGEQILLKDLSKQLKQFARGGGPDLHDLRGYPQPASPKSTIYVMPSNQSSHSIPSKSRNTLGDSTEKTTTSNTKRTSPYDRNFGQSLLDNSIYLNNYLFPDGRKPGRPDNANEILDRLGQPRRSLSPSQFTEEAFLDFQQSDSDALNEDAIMGTVFPLIQGSARIPSAKNMIFGNLKPLTPDNLVNAKPDSYDGAHPAQIDRRIREKLGPYIIPSTQYQAPTLPNFFTEVKGPDGSTSVARLQACYNGAIGARGIHELRSFGEQNSLTVHDNNAYSITSTYHDGHLRIYTTHSTGATSDENLPEYHMTQIGGWALNGSSEQFRQGVRAFRNARDWAKEKRNELIAIANSKAVHLPTATTNLDSSAQSMSQSTTEPVVLESETSADELSPDELSMDVSQKSSQSNKRLKREPEKRPEKGYAGASSRSRSRGRLLHKR